MRKISVLTFLITAFALGVFAQQGRIDAGIQVKPIFSAPMLRTGPIDMVEGDTRFTVTLFLLPGITFKRITHLSLPI